LGASFNGEGAIRYLTYLDTIERNSKEYHTLQTFLNQGTKESLQLVDAPSALPGKSKHSFTGFGIIRDKDGIHEH
jgi:hypothetical protein